MTTVEKIELIKEMEEYLKSLSPKYYCLAKAHILHNDSFVKQMKCLKQFIEDAEQEQSN